MSLDVGSPSVENIASKSHAPQPIDPPPPVLFPFYRFDLRAADEAHGSEPSN